MRGLYSSILTALFLMLVAACDTGSFLYTQNELSDMYQVVLENPRGTSGSRQALFNPKDVLLIKLNISSNAPSPDLVLVDLLDNEDRTAATVAFRAQDSAQTSRPEAIAVASFRDTLPPVRLPDSLTDGYYRLNIQLLDAAGKNLTTSSHSILIYGQNTPEIRISLHPASLGPSEQALLKANFVGSVGQQAWMRWRINEKIWQEGLVSEFNDRIIWQANEIQSIHTIQAEYFPFEPPSGASPLTLRSIKVPVSKSAQPRLELSLEGSQFNRIDLGMLAAEAAAGLPSGIKISSFGKFYPESNSRGYGFAFAVGSGLSVPAGFIPEKSEHPDFSIVVAIEPLPGFNTYPIHGDIFRISSGTGDSIIAIGVRNSRLYLDAQTREQSPQTLPDEALLITLNAVSRGDELRLTAFVNDEPQLSTTIKDFRQAESQTSFTLAGIDGFGAVYETVLSLTKPVLPFELLAERQYGDRLIRAIDFENSQHLPVLASEPGAETAEDPLSALSQAASEEIRSNPDSSDSVKLLDLPGNLTSFNLWIEHTIPAPDLVLHLSEQRQIVYKASGTISFDGKSYELPTPLAGSENQRSLTVTRRPEGLEILRKGQATLILAVEKPEIIGLSASPQSRDNREENSQKHTVQKLLLLLP